MQEEPKTKPVDAPANPPAKDPETTVEPVIVPTEPDYKEKFSHSTREAQRLADELKARDAEIERLKSEKDHGTSHGNDSDPLFPGFDELGDEEKKNLQIYTDTIEKRVTDKFLKNPAIAFANQSYNEKNWNDAFEHVASEFPELRDEKERADFKAKYFKADNVPSNIKDILKDIAKIHLFDRAKDMGAAEAKRQAERIEIERQQGGDKTPAAGRTLEDWNRLAESNPAQFAKLSKQFNEDMASGKLK